VEIVGVVVDAVVDVTRRWWSNAHKYDLMLQTIFMLAKNG